jgi:serine/threonine protein kinase
MAPELLRREGASEHADQYSAALVLYEMLCGRLPWDVDVRDAAAVAKAHLKTDPIPASRYCPWIPQRVDSAILRALAKRPGERWTTVGEFADQLSELQQVDDGSASASPDVNTTAPTLATLAAGSSEQDAIFHDTTREAMALPIEGPSLELWSLPSPGSDASHPSSELGDVETLLKGLSSQPLGAAESSAGSRDEAITRPYAFEGATMGSPQQGSLDTPDKIALAEEEGASPPFESVGAAMAISSPPNGRLANSARWRLTALALTALAAAVAIGSGRRMAKRTSAQETSTTAIMPAWLEAPSAPPSEPPPSAIETPRPTEVGIVPRAPMTLELPLTAAAEGSAAPQSQAKKGKPRRRAGPAPTALRPGAPDDGRELF